jgi:GNAT superfamily N-acetyltransferase
LKSRIWSDCTPWTNRWPSNWWVTSNSIHCFFCVFELFFQWLFLHSAYSRQWLHACLCTHNPKWRAWTAVDGNSPIGFLMSQSRSKPSGRGKKRRRVCSSYIELFWVLVEPMYRHQGVATLMYQRLLAECTDSNNCFSNADEIRFCQSSNRLWSFVLNSDLPWSNIAGCMYYQITKLLAAGTTNLDFNPFNSKRTTPNRVLRRGEWSN